MINIIRDFRCFNANSINDKISDADKRKITDLLEDLNKYKEEKIKKQSDLKSLSQNKQISCTTNKSGKFTRPALILDYDYTKDKQARIFDLKSRTNGKYIIRFKNKDNTPMEILGSMHNIDEQTNVYVPFLYHNSPVIQILFNKKVNISITLDRFLYLVHKKEFKNITPKKFYYTYLRSYKKSKLYREKKKSTEEELKTIDSNISCIETELQKYKDLYYSEKELITSSYYKETSKYLKLEKEANLAEVMRQKSEMLKGLNKTKSIWDSIMTKEEKALVIGWVSKNIYSMRLYVLASGASEKAMDRDDAFPDAIYGKKRRSKPLYQDGKLVSCDGIFGYMSFRKVDSAPTYALAKLTRSKDPKHLFVGNRLNDLNLMLFILAIYNKYGFKVGVKNLWKYIDTEMLKNNEFIGIDETAYFNTGYRL